MPDIVDQQTRSRMMAGIRGRDTRPELTIRRGLHAQGFRYRLHAVDVPGKPDLVLPRWHAAIFVNGCFWHGHDCHLFRMPSSRTEFWSTKIERNRARDAKVAREVREAGWRALTIWECALEGRTRLDPEELIERVVRWLRGNADIAEIAGHA